MKVKIIRNTVAQGKPVFAGEEIELQKEEARILIAYGKAVGIADNPPAPETAVLPKPEKAVEISAAAKGKKEKAKP